MDGLKECLFCTGEAELINDDTTTYGFPTPNWAVRCVMEDCIAHDINPCYAYIESAIEAWNRRATPPNEPLTLGQLRQTEGEPVWFEASLAEVKGWMIVKDIDKYCIP